MLISRRSLRGAAAGALGAGALTGALLFGGVPVAHAAPAPVPVSVSPTTLAAAGPHGAPGGAGVIPARWGHGHWWHHGWGHRGFWGHRHWWNWWW